MKETQYFVAKTFAGLEPLLAEELTKLGAQNCVQMSRSVSFEGDLDMMYRANYFCRTALRILWRQKKFTFRSNKHFYEELFDFPAEEFLDAEGTLAVHATTVNSIFNTPLYAAVLAKDAICDRFRDLYDKRPSVDKEQPDVQFHLHIFEDEAQLFLDSSGESLHKRGYKIRNHPAPLNEVVAAAMIQLSGWNGECDFIDPMCGGGTLLIEAAMKALHIPAGFYRNEYGFYFWKNFDRSTWKNVINEADIKDDVNINFYGSDIEPHYLNFAKENAKKAQLQDFITFKVQDMRTSKPERTPALVMMNPPYGERLEVEDINTLYSEIGDTLKNQYPGCKAFLISSDKEALKHIALHPSKKATLFNGPLECKFLGYDLFEGDHKSFVIQNQQNI